MYKANLLL